MKYRVRLDLSFADEADAAALMAFARGLAGRAVNMNAGRADEEFSFCDLERCRHDEGLPCEKMERVEVGR